MSLVIPGQLPALLALPFLAGQLLFSLLCIGGILGILSTTAGAFSPTSFLESLFLASSTFRRRGVPF